MIVGGFSYVGTLARPAHAIVASQPPAERQGDQSKAQSIEAAGEPTYFRSISAISPGSLAGVYQSMRAQEASSGFDAGDVVPVRAEAAAAILSGAGIPAAMTAYGEVMEAEGK